MAVGHTQEKCRNKEKLKCARCVKRGVNASHSFLLCKHRVVDKSERESTLIAAEVENAGAIEEENAPSSS